MRGKRGGWRIKLQPQRAGREKAFGQETGFLQAFLLHYGVRTSDRQDEAVDIAHVYILLTLVAGIGVCIDFCCMAGVRAG